MYRASPDMSVLERQQLLNYMNGNDQMNMFSIVAQAQQFPGFIDGDQGLNALVNMGIKQDSGWYDQFGHNTSYCSATGIDKGSGYDINCTIPRTISCPPAMAEDKGKEPDKLSSNGGRESFRKRKIDKSQSQKVNPLEEPKEKKMKEIVQESDSMITEQQTSNTDPSSDISKVTEVKKLDYIHVRARRGQATDSHSLAERVRREKISERMKYLQDLVPGCNKIIGKAGMLDEIINYVQSLQKQVEFLSMKLAAVNPAIDINLDSLFMKEIIQAGTGDFTPDMTNLQFHPSMNTPDMALRRTISAPITLPETILDQAYQIQHPSTCDAELQNLYAMEFQQGKPSSYFPQPFTGYIEAGHVKLQM